MPYTMEQYQTLCAMIAKGVLSMEQNGEKVTFRSFDEMRKLKIDMERALGIGVRPAVHYPAFSKG